MSITAGQTTVKRIIWADASPLHARLQARGIAAATFPAYVDRVRETNASRIREGDLDHLVFYLLQSTRFTGLAPLEPALGAKALVDSLDVREREVFLREGRADPVRIPAPVRMRAAALLRALDSKSTDARLTYFRELVSAAFPDRRGREAALLREYLRVIRFVYEKEFVAQRAPQAPAAVAELYRSRGLSTDTAVEAGYLVYVGLGVVKALNPDRQVRRVLIVGPGLDLAPRTSLREEDAPQSYQPWAVIDALLALGLSRTDDLELVAADINPRVVAHLRRSRDHPPTLTLMSEIQDTDAVRLTQEYRDYFRRLGDRVGEPAGAGAAGHLRKEVRVRPAAARALRAETLDVVTERLDGPAFDLIVATNVLTYFDDAQLMLAMTNISGMLAPGGVLLHNEARALLADVTAELGLPIQQARTGMIATVRGAPSLSDSVFLHVRRASAVPAPYSREQDR